MGSTLFHALSGCDTVSAFHHSMELEREQHGLYEPVCLLSQRFVLGSPVRKARYSATTWSKSKDMLFCCISVRQHTTM